MVAPEPPRSRYAVPLTALDAVRVPVDQQVALEPEPRTTDLPGDPVIWGLAIAAAEIGHPARRP